MSFVKASASPPPSADLLGGVGDPARVAVEKGHRCAGAGEHESGRGADPAPGARDHRDPALERQHVRDVGHGSER